MEEPRSHQDIVRETFDSLCKKVLKYNAIDIQRQISRQCGREVMFSELTEQDFAKLSMTDEYFKDAYVFFVLGENVGVTDSDLAEALNEIPADRRDIVLMSYFFDMTDAEIAARLKVARRTVAHRRTSTLKKLKKLMEESED